MRVLGLDVGSKTIGVALSDETGLLATPLETLEQALAIVDYDAFRAEQAAARDNGRYLGVGIACYVEPSTPGYGTYGTEAATIRLARCAIPRYAIKAWTARPPDTTPQPARRPPPAPSGQSQGSDTSPAPAPVEG